MDSFASRFGIEVGTDKARELFMNRVHDAVFVSLALGGPDSNVHALWQDVFFTLGIRQKSWESLSEHIPTEFLSYLQALEAMHAFMSANDRARAQRLNAIIEHTLKIAEVDLGVRWENGHFRKAGAELLDKALVVDVLAWLRVAKYETVYEPFEKGLRHLLNSAKQPELLADVVTDMYEALEALSKIVTGKPDRDLSAQRELFIKAVKASAEYKQLLAAYIDYGCKFRHAAKPGEQKPALSEREVESFVYLTGVFIRLAL